MMNPLLEILRAAALIGLGLLFCLVVLWLVVFKAFSRLAARLGHSSPCPASFSWMVNNPIRRLYMKPILERVGIRPGERVLELGPGPGAFTVDAARMLGESGRLIAVDIQPEMIARLERRAREAGLANIETHVADAHHLPLEDASVDRAFLVTVLPEILDRARALAELRRVLKSGGTLSITEEFLDPDYLFAGETIRLVESAGFRQTRRAGNFWIYTMNFESPGPNGAGVKPSRMERGKKAGNDAQVE
jgi:SAM-dependent methyltransferase